MKIRNGVRSCRNWNCDGAVHKINKNLTNHAVVFSASRKLVVIFTKICKGREQQKFQALKILRLSWV